jgi:hypothetical protein
MAKAGTSRRKRSRPTRARRFEIHAPVRYRADDGRWHAGRTESISRSGLLLHAEEALTPDTAIEMVVELPPIYPGEPSPCVVCHGRVVRTVAEEVDGTLVATEFTHYTFGRPESDDPAVYET